MRSGVRLQGLDQPFLRPRAQVRILVRALLGPMPELGLHRLDRLAAGDGLARDRVPPTLWWLSKWSPSFSYGIGARLRDSAPLPSETHRSRLMRKREARSR